VRKGERIIEERWRSIKIPNDISWVVYIGLKKVKGKGIRGNYGGGVQGGEV